MQQNILLHSGMITPDILFYIQFFVAYLNIKSVLNILGYFLKQLLENL